MTVPAEKVNLEKTAEKPVEKRRALGRGLESLLPGGPRMVPAAPAPGAGSVPAPEDGLAGDAGGTSALPGEGAASPGTIAALQAAAARQATDGQPVLDLAINQIDHNPHQTRTDFDQEFLAELARSIQIQGVIQPIVVRPGKEGRYILILGDRRLRASKLAGKATIPAIVKRVSEQQAAEMTIVENLQREDLDCMEQAEAFAHLSSEFKMTQEEIGKRVGLSRETVSNYMRLLQLPVDVTTALNRGFLTYSHARELLCLNDETQVSRVAQMVIKKKMSVLQLEELVSDINFPRGGPEEPKRTGARWVDPNVRAAQRSLAAILGMKVRIRDRKGKGKITIEYGTIEDFDRLVRMLKGK
jgi:ParB family transcriptional regulator, chromosome partitioning protein